MCFSAWIGVVASVMLWGCKQGKVCNRTSVLIRLINLVAKMSFQTHKILFTSVIVVVLNTTQQLWAVASLRLSERGVLSFSLLISPLIHGPEEGVVCLDVPAFANVICSSERCYLYLQILPCHYQRSKRNKFIGKIRRCICKVLLNHKSASRINKS